MSHPLPTTSRPVPAMRPPAGTRGRAIVVAILLLVSSTGLATVLPSFREPASAAAALSPAEQDFVQRINALRASHGLGPLVVDQNLTDLARSHTQEMIDSHSLHHTPDLTVGVVADWQKLGENVGFGPTTGQVFDAFVKSPHHLANLVEPTYTHVGVGVIVDRAGVQWTTHRFMSLVTPSPDTAPPTTRAPAPPTTEASTPATPASAPTTAATAPPAGPSGSGGSGGSSGSSAGAGTTSGSAGGGSPAEPGAVDAALEALHAL